MDEIIEILHHSLIDTLKMLPFLFAVYLLIEYLEHKASNRLADSLRRLGPLGPVGGALIGSIPQCGFSVAVSNLYSGRLVSLGTLMAVYIATSDEAVPILISNRAGAGKIWGLIAAKVIIAVVFGLAVDLFIRVFNKNKNEQKAPYHELCEGCGCEEHGIFRSALKHTVMIYLFLLLVTVCLNVLIHLLGESRLNDILMANSPLQPLIAALIGLTPNCSASVILTNLYANGSLSFGSAVAGLSTGAGLGLVVLYKTNKNIRQNVFITLLLYAFGAVSGLVIDLIL